MGFSRRTIISLAGALYFGGVSTRAQNTALMIVEKGVDNKQPKTRVRSRIAVEEAFTLPELMPETLHYVTKVAPHNEPGEAAIWGELLASKTNLGKETTARLVDLKGQRIEEMNKHGISMQVLSLTTPGVQIFDPKRALEFSQLVNNRLADLVQELPDRFAGLAAIPPQAPERAAAELNRSVNDLGLKGAIINSHTFGEYLDDEKYWPILEQAEKLGVPIYLHPRPPSAAIAAPFVDLILEGAMWGFMVEAGLHAMRLIVAGVFDRFPNLKIVLGHMGEGIPYYLSRIDLRYQGWIELTASPRDRKLKRRPSEYFKDNFYITTSGVMDDDVLRYCNKVLGTEKIMFAVDYPYESTEDSVNFLDNSTLSEAEKEKIYHLNAKRVFSI